MFDVWSDAKMEKRIKELESENEKLKNIRRQDGKMKKIIHINRNIIQQNEKHGRKLPVCRIDMDGKTWYGSKIEILGPSEMIYSPDKPRSCGAKLWIETQADVVIHDKTTYKEMKK
jgi:hypothetical protein